MQTDLLQPARQLLSGVTLQAYLATRPPRTVTSVAAGEQLGTVLERFACTGLVAAPLFADEARMHYLGFVDLMNVVAAVVAATHQATPGSNSGHALRHRAAAAARVLAAQPVGSISATNNDAQVVYQTQLDNTLEDVVRQGFADPVDKLACHRLAVFQPSGNVEDSSSASSSSMVDSSDDLAGMALDCGSGGGSSMRGSLQLTAIVSQSDIIHFLHRHQKELGQAVLGSTLAQLGFQEKPVMCVPADMAVFDALAGMVDSRARVPAVAVIDSFESGLLIGNLSISDLRGILPKHFDQMAEPVGEFLGGAWHDSPHWQPTSPRGGMAAEFGIKSPEQLPHLPSLAVCRLDSTFGEVLGTLVEGRLHRVFITNNEGKPAGVVSITDILRRIALLDEAI